MIARGQRLGPPTARSSVTAQRLQKKPNWFESLIAGLPGGLYIFRHRDIPRERRTV